GRLARPRIVVAAVTLTTVIAGLVAIGLEPRLLVPSQWGTLGRDLGDGLSGAFAASYPYHGADPWTRTVILLGLPLPLGIAAGLAFPPHRRPPAVLARDHARLVQRRPLGGQHHGAGAVPAAGARRPRPAHQPRRRARPALGTPGEVPSRRAVERPRGRAGNGPASERRQP